MGPKLVKIYTFGIVLILASKRFPTCLGQSIQEPCPAPHPCICLNNIIDCSSQNLSYVVSFDFHSNQDIFHSLDYRNNELNYIPVKAFIVLNIRTLLLSWNNISSIHAWGFKGLELSLKYLDLSHNSLKTLPVATEILINIISLHIHDNPVDGSDIDGDISDGFTDHVMYSLGKNITEFSFGHENALRHWPETLRHFQQLKTLRVIGLNMLFLHLNSFHGFEQTIKSLTIEKAVFRRVPEEIEHLLYLEELQINLNRYAFGDELLGEHTLRKMNRTLTTLSLNFNNMTTIPETVKYLQRLQNLSFEGNKLELLTEHAIEILTYTNISFLSFKYCLLKRIPSSLSLLERLRVLDLSFNRLVTIENSDLWNIPSLERLLLNDNPLRYIADSEMIGLYSLCYLNLTNTRLITLPEAIRNLISLQILDIENVPIDCTCDMFWVKRWMIWFDVQVEFYGTCETIDQTLQSYVNDRLPTCPDLAEQEIG